jgi:beta-xylosidase
MKEKYLLIILVACITMACCSRKVSPPVPLFIDPNYHGSCDPEIIYNTTDGYYYIYYTARRSLLEENFVRTPIGVIRSKDLADWEFLGYCKFDGVGGTKDADATFWAPAIVSHQGRLHMFVTWKPDTCTTLGPWGGPSYIVHYTTSENDPVDGWEKVTALHDDNINALDATAYIKDGKCHVWFKGREKEARKNELIYMASNNFREWEYQGFSKSDVFNEAATGSDFEEAPYLFFLKGSYWLITDPHAGLFVYRSDDAESWEFQGTILEEGGSKELDGTMARHASVAIVDDRAFIVYHVEPWRRYDLEKLRGDQRVPIFRQPIENRRSVLQMAELELIDGKLVCDRDAEVML